MPKKRQAELDAAVEARREGRLGFDDIERIRDKMTFHPTLTLEQIAEYEANPYADVRDFQKQLEQGRVLVGHLCEKSPVFQDANFLLQIVATHRLDVRETGRFNRIMRELGMMPDEVRERFSTLCLTLGAG